MSCENGFLPTSALSDLILRANGDFSFNDNLNNQQTDSAFPVPEIPASALNADRLAGIRSLATAIESGEFDTGSGLAGELFGNSSTIYDADGNPLSADGFIDPNATGNFASTSEVFNQIESFAANIDLTAPTQIYDRQTIVDVTNALNNFLAGGSGGASIGGGAGGADGGGLADFPNLQDRFNNLPSLSFTEVGNFLVDSATDPNELLDSLANPQLTLATSATLSNALSGLENFYTANLGKDIAAGICSATASIIQKILGVIALIDTAKAVITLVKNILELDLVKLAEQLLARLTVEAIVQAIKEAIKKVYEKIKAKLLAILERFKEMICGLIGGAQRALTKLNEKCTELEDFYSEENLKNFTTQIEAFITKLASEFERLTFENVILLLERLCAFVTEIQNLLFGPLLAFQQFGNTIAAENKMMRSVSLKNTKLAVAYGALRLSPADRKALIEVARQQNNEQSASIDELLDGATTDYYTAKEVTCEESLELFCLKPEGVPLRFTFSGQPLEGKPQYYKFVKPIVYARLMRMSLRLGKEFTIIKAFEPKPDDEALGSAKNSIMSTGGAIHIRANGYDEISRIIVSASQEGFVGIGIHQGYVHLDIGPRKLTWVAGYSSGFQDSDDGVTELGNASGFQGLLERHERKEFTRKVL